MDSIRVLIVDDNQQLCDLTRRFLEAREEIEVVGVANHGRDAMELIASQRPDVLLLDLIMPQVDGYTILEQLGADESIHRPEVIVLTALARDDFIQRAINLGARYYMVKPFDYNMLYKRILEVAGLRREEISVRPSALPQAASAPSLDENIANMFLTIGIPAHIKGYHFLREAVKMVVDDAEMINAITKQLYPGIAKRFNTSASKVERAIRHSIEVAWTRGRVDNFNQVFGYKVFSPGEKPTNGEFIALIADKLSIERTA